MYYYLINYLLTKDEHGGTGNRAVFIAFSGALYYDYSIGSESDYKLSGVFEMMLYESTRGRGDVIPSAEAIKKGIAADGGLYVPRDFVRLSMEDIEALVPMTYQERAKYILKGYLDDFTADEISDCVDKAYNTRKFSSEDIAPVVMMNSSLNILELWHGPTCAFKDMALQILPHFLVKAMRKTGETDEIVILVATSGDTGKAALEGFADVEGTRIIVFYPDGGVSEIQKRQMVTQEGRNVLVFGVEGNFDDTQTGVKQIFTDEALIGRMKEKGLKFSSANSINWGRLVPQIVYYFSAYADMVKQGRISFGEKINFVVPTGNFGNILAGYYAMRMGLPVNKMVCASNDNKVLTDFIHSGVYDRRRDFVRTISPSMDILISSNLERLLYELSGRDPERVNDWMARLRNDGYYYIGSAAHRVLNEHFWGGWSSQEETLKTIECVYNEYGYVCDTHTAVGVDVYDKYVITTGDLTPTVMVSTASPFKFNASVCKALSMNDSDDEFELLRKLSEKTGLPVPEGLRNLEDKPVLHGRVCRKEEMKNVVMEALGI